MSVFLANEQNVAVDTSELREIAAWVLAKEGYPVETEATILLVNDDEIAGYNRRFLGRDAPTDVLAFPLEELVPGVVPDVESHGPPMMVGDVVVAPSYVRRQASSFDTTFEDEMALMVTHGVLHLLGYVHDDEDEAARMEERERELMAHFGRTRR